MIDNLQANTVFIPVKLSRNSLKHTIEAANPNLTSRTGLKYFLDIKTPAYAGSSTFSLLHASSLRERPPYSVGGVQIFEGAAVCYNNRFGKLDSLLTLHKPEFDAKEPFVVTTQTMQYILRERVTGGTPVVNISNELEPIWISKAGINEQDYIYWGETLFSEVQKEQRKFLTNQPSKKVAGKNQTEYLSFLLNVNPMPEQLQLRIEADGKTTTYQVIVMPPFMSIAVFPINFTELGLENASEVTVWLANENLERLTETRTYYIDPIERTQERYIVFNNSLGGWDTIRLTGVAVEQLKVTQQNLLHDSSPFKLGNIPELFVSDLKIDNSLTVSTGYFERNIAVWMDYFTELMASEAIYFVTEKGHQQLQRATNQLVTKEDNFGNVARVFQFDFVGQNSNYSAIKRNIPSMEAINAGWIGFGQFLYLTDNFGKRTGYKRPESLVYANLATNEPLKPLQVKQNSTGTEGYIGSILDAAIVVGSTPYPSDVYTRQTTYKKQTCLSGYDGLPATITIAAGTYGGEKPGDANILAKAAADALNTQAYANANGGCTPIGPVYTWDIPANHWHYRVKSPSTMSIRFTNDGGWGTYPAGNDSSVQNLTGSYIFPVNTNDLNFPVAVPNYLGWKLKVIGASGTTKNLKYYRNGVLKYTRSITFNSNGYWEGAAFSPSGGEGYIPANQDKTFWEVV